MSVFRAANNPGGAAANNLNSGRRDPYPINRPREEPIPDGPTERLAGRAARRRPDRIAWLGVLVAVLALTTSAIAVLTAWRATAPAGTVTAGAARAPEPAGTDFAVTYAQEPLRVQVGCSAVLFLDLDEPRANAPEKAGDLRYDSRCGREAPRLTLGPGAEAGAQLKNSDTDAAGCERAIRTGPIGPGASVEVRRGAVLCVLTSASPPSVALVEVTDVGRTGVAGLRATSWKVAG